MLEWLKEILGDNYNDELDEKVSKEIGTRFVGKDQYDKLKTVKEETDKQLTKVNEDLSKFKDSNPEELKQQIEQMQAQHEKEKAEITERANLAEYKSNINTIVSKEKFSSEAAKRAFLNDLVGKNLPYENDNLTGYEDFKKSYIENDPGAFIANEDVSTTKMNTGGNKQEPASLEKTSFIDAARDAAGLE